MTTDARSASSGSTALPTTFKLLAWASILSLIAYFVVTHALRYFVFTKASYGDYFWSRAAWLFPHVAGGLLAIVIGPLQFWPRMRRDYLPFHRIAGRVYVVAVLLGSAVAFRLAAISEDTWGSYSLGLTGLGVAWVATTAMALVAIRRKNLLQHKQWMTRSYVVTFAFVTFRLFDQWMGAHHIMTDDERGRFLAWGCWAVPLLFTELVLQANAVFRAPARASVPQG
jgi:uncharacterized membrane protein